MKKKNTNLNEAKDWKEILKEAENKLKTFYTDYFPNDVFTKKAENDPSVEKLKEMIILIKPDFTTESIDDLELSEIFKRLYKASLPTPQPLSDILVKYYEYLNELSTDSEDETLKAEYKIATKEKDNFNYVGRDNNYLIQKIKDSNYVPNKTDNRDFFSWFEGSTIDPQIKIDITNYKNEIDSLNVSTDEEKIKKYFEGLMRWNSKTGEIERLKIKTTTQEKLNLLIQYKDKYQYIESVESLVPVIIKSVVNDNEVQL